MMNYQVIFCILFWIGSTTVTAQESITYQKPPADIEKLVLATFNPNGSFNDAGDWMVLMQRSAAPTVEDLAQPELRIAGLRINPANFSPSRSSYFTGLLFKNTGSGKEFAIKGLPANLKASQISWSPAGDKIAFVQENRSSLDLYIADLKTLFAKKINKTPLNLVTGMDYDWLNNETLLYFTTTALASALPRQPLAPAGPVMQQNLGKVAASRTHQDLIKNKYDEDIFRFLARAQMVLNTKGVEKKIAAPQLYTRVELSPDKKYFLVEKLTGELSYLVPFNGFSKNIELWDANGKLVKFVTKRPSSELAPSGFDNVLNAPRGYTWIATQPATLGWIEPLDSGFIKKDVPNHDAFFVLGAPFTGKPDTVVKTPLRINNLSFVNDTLALLNQASRAKQRQVWQRLNPKTGKQLTLSDLSSNDAYNDLGTPYTEKNKLGRRVPIIYKNSKFIMRGQGASPKGDYPFISIFDFTTLQSEKLWQSEDPNYETPLKLLSYNDKIRIFTSRQSATQIPDYYLVTVGEAGSKPLTHFSDPQPELRNLKKEKIIYTRKDGIQLSATVYTAKEYNPIKDGPLPVIIVAYPREYKSASDAAQVRGSANTFTQVGYGSFVFFALKGYAVMDNTEFPIVGEKDKYPNDNFVEQLQWNAEAAIQKIASMGLGDSSRVAVAGHSYGAFMTANLLAHTRLFKAGIARSGAYNRTLTPFGFQNEERTYWQAPEVYYRMSPFSYASNIKDALLLIHGEADNNAGTFPIQSERLYNAIKGHGGTVRYVQLPFESHGYAAKENILHMLWEEYEWLERYVKNAKQ